MDGAMMLSGTWLKVLPEMGLKLLSWYKILMIKGGADDYLLASRWWCDRKGVDCSGKEPLYH